MAWLQWVRGGLGAAAGIERAGAGAGAGVHQHLPSSGGQRDSGGPDRNSILPAGHFHFKAAAVGNQAGELRRALQALGHLRDAWSQESLYEVHELLLSSHAAQAGVQDVASSSAGSDPRYAHERRGHFSCNWRFHWHLSGSGKSRRDLVYVEV